MARLFGLFVMVVVGGVVLIRAVRRRSSPPARVAAVEDEVDLSSRDSFPASDPPSWTHVRV